MPFDPHPIDGATPGCPSDLQLDRLDAEELEGAAAEALHSHLSGCSACQERRRAAAAGFEAVDVAAHAARIHAAVGGRVPANVAERVREGMGWPRPTGSRGGLGAWVRRRWPAPAGGGAALAAVAVVWLAGVGRPPAGGRDPVETVTPKGLGFVVHRQVVGGSEALLSGEPAHEGDVLRYQVDVPAPGWLMVAGVESSGALYVSYPTDGGPAVAVDAAQNRLLPGAAALDASLGVEWLHMVWCASPFALQDLKRGASGAELQVPAGCQTARFELRKTPRRAAPSMPDAP